MNKHCLKSILLILIMTASLSISSCFHSIVKQSDLQDARAVESSQTYYFWGLLSPVTVEKPCENDRLLGVEREVTLMDGIITNLTFGIYTPLHMTYYCKK